MFLILLVLTLAVSLATAALVVRFFRAPIGQILDRIIGDSLAEGWKKFLTFALYVVGVSSGTHIWKLEEYLRSPFPGPGGATPVHALNGSALALEVYRTVVQTLQGMAWGLLLFFTVALVAFAIARRSEGSAGGRRAAP